MFIKAFLNSKKKKMEISDMPINLKLILHPYSEILNEAHL